MRPQDFEQRIREGLIDRISSALRWRFPQGRVYCFGSFAAGMYLPTADMDLAFVSEKFKHSGQPQFRITYSWMRQVLTTLEHADIACYEGSSIISKARVPIIKFVDGMTGLKVDISFENMSGVVANKTFQEWIAQFPAMPKLVCLIKQFLLMRNLNEVVDGGIGGFSISCLVVSLLQHHPAIQSGSMVQEHHLGELLLDFFDLYGNKFNMTTTAIRMKPPGYIVKFVEVCRYF